MKQILKIIDNWMSIFSNLDKVNNSTIFAIAHSKVQTFVTTTCWTLIFFISIQVEIDSHLPLFRICLCSHLIWDWFRFTFVLHLPLSHLSWDWFTFTFVPHLTFFPIWVEIDSDSPLFRIYLCSHLSWDWFTFTFVPHWLPRPAEELAWMGCMGPAVLFFPICKRKIINRPTSGIGIRRTDTNTC